MEEMAFLLLPGFSAMAFFAAVEPLRIANRLAGRELYRWSVHVARGDHAEASNGLQIRGQGPIDESIRTLVVCAGFDPLELADARLLGLLRRVWRRGGNVGAIDTGAFLLAEAGILGREPITLHWEAASEFALRYPRIPVSSELFERHSRLFTCAGGTAAMDLMLETIAFAHGGVLAKAVSDQLIHDRIRSPRESQRGEDPAFAGNPVLGPVVRIMESNLAEPLSLERIAEVAGIDRRRIERQFRRVLGQTPGHYYRELKLRRALELIREQGLSVHEAAAIGGFSSQSVFSRACRNHFGKGPRELLAAGFARA
ncbi:MAG: helix-turn-helix domain-containing protein [Sphingomonadaceae bacterium]